MLRWIEIDIFPTRQPLIDRQCWNEPILGHTHFTQTRLLYLVVAIVEPTNMIQNSIDSAKHFNHCVTTKSAVHSHTTLRTAQTVARLMNLRRFPSERVADIVKRLTVSVSDGPNAKGRDVSGGRGRYVLRVLGESKVVGTLAGALSCAINTLADLDSGILERLENTGGRTRRNVARSQAAIHPGRDDLNNRHTLEFRPGWWISTNYSYPDIRRILKDICREAGLSYGRDLEFCRLIPA